MNLNEPWMFWRVFSAPWVTLLSDKDGVKQDTEQQANAEQKDAVYSLEKVRNVIQMIVVWIARLSVMSAILL